MWLFNSSIGRKFVMAVTGACLVLFVTFHVLMNAVALIWPDAYNQVCEFLGANWYALIASAGLALLFIIHIVYACWLTVQNRAARGNDRYAVTSRPPQVEWASKNMLVLGIVVLAFLVVHLIQFWAKMQWMELRHADLSVLPQLNGTPVMPAQGSLFLQMAFSNWWTPVVYIIGFVALWFHMTHGFWSMFHSAGWNNQTWIPRLKCIGNVWTTIVIALFVAQAVVFTVQAHKNYYINNVDLQQQYYETYADEADKLFVEFNDGAASIAQPYMQKFYEPTLTDQDRQKIVEEYNDEVKKYLSKNGVKFVNEMELLENAINTNCPDIAVAQDLMQKFEAVAQTHAQLAGQGLMAPKLDNNDMQLNVQPQ